MVLKAQALALTFLNVTQSQASAYSQLKKELGFSKQELIQYLQISMIQNNPNGNIVISLKDKKPVV